MKRKLLLSEPPLQILPTLATLVGLNESIVLQQLFYLLQQANFGKVIGGQRWIFNTYEEWQRTYFPFWSVITLKRTFASLEKSGLVISCQPEGGISRRKYYRVDEAAVDDRINLAPSSDQNDTMDGSKCAAPITKTTSKTSAKITQGHFGKCRGGFVDPSDPSWKPRFPYPLTEEEMYEALEANDIETSEDYDGRFFETMTRNGWRIRGERVWDWMETYQRRLDVTMPERNRH